MKISEEAAQAQIDIAVDVLEIDFEDFEDDESLKIVKGNITKIKKFIMKGRCEISETDGIFKIIQRLKNGNEDSTLTWNDRAGKAKKAMGLKSENDHYGKLHAFAGSMTGVGEKAITDLCSVDQKLSEVLAALFLSI